MAYLLSRLESETERELKQWFSSFPEVHTDSEAIPQRTFINHLHYDMTQTWTIHNTPEQRFVWSNLDEPPPWNPTLQDVFNESDIKQYYDPQKIIDTMNHESEFSITSLTTPLTSDHIKHVKNIADTESTFYIQGGGSSESRQIRRLVNNDALSQPEIERLILENFRNDYLEKKQLTQETINELCATGLSLLEETMETDSILSEGNYLELCNVFKQLHNST
jgi:hypothetical protein